MASHMSDLVRDSKLSATFDGPLTQHVAYYSDKTSRQRRRRTEQSWRREREIDSGSFGQVWLERRVSGSSPAELRAVKAISKSRSGIDYYRELEAICKFSHPNYVHCFVESYGWYENEDFIFIAMEFLEKGDLGKYLGRPFPESETGDIVSQLLDGLCFMHEHGFAHRDMKPANILVLEAAPEWWVKIGDFGISKRAQEGITELRTVIGTSNFLAPEVIGLFPADDLDIERSLADHAYTNAVDIWALGQIAFLLICNELAFYNDRVALSRYVTMGVGFPREIFEQRRASTACYEFVYSAMTPSRRRRPTAAVLSDSPWLLQLESGKPLERSQKNQQQLIEPEPEPDPTPGTRLAPPGSDVGAWPSQPTLDATARWSTMKLTGELATWKGTTLQEEAISGSATERAMLQPDFGGPGNYSALPGTRREPNRTSNATSNTTAPISAANMRSTTASNPTNRLVGESPTSFNQAQVAKNDAVVTLQTQRQQAPPFSLDSLLFPASTTGISQSDIAKARSGKLKFGNVLFKTSGDGWGLRSMKHGNLVMKEDRFVLKGGAFSAFLPSKYEILYDDITDLSFRTTHVLVAVAPNDKSSGTRLGGSDPGIEIYFFDPAEYNIWKGIVGYFRPYLK